MDLLTFHLGVREFGVDLGRVLEILNPPPITRVPEMPPALLGLIGLRGDPTGVVDAGLRLEGRPVELSARTPVLILRAVVDDMTVPFGLLVDAAGRRVSVEQLLPWNDRQADFLGRDACIGFADLDGRLVLVLDVDRLLVFPPIPPQPRPTPGPSGPVPPAGARAEPSTPPKPVHPGPSGEAVPPPAAQSATPAASVPQPAPLSPRPSGRTSPPAAQGSPSSALAPTLRPPSRAAVATAAHAMAPALAREVPTSGSFRGTRTAPASSAGRSASSRSADTHPSADWISTGSSPAASSAAEPVVSSPGTRFSPAPPPARGEEPLDPRPLPVAAPSPAPVPRPPVPAAAEWRAPPPATAITQAASFTPPPALERTSPSPRPSGGRIPGLAWVALAALALVALIFALMQFAGGEKSSRRQPPSAERREAAPPLPPPASLPAPSNPLPPPPLAAAAEPMAPAAPVPDLRGTATKTAADAAPSRPADPPVASPLPEQATGSNRRTAAPAEPPPSAPPRKARPLPQAMQVTPDTPTCEIHEVRRGDTLWWISARKLGSPYRWPELFGENRGVIVDPDVIEIHDRIRIPGGCAPSPAR